MYAFHLSSAESPSDYVIRSNTIAERLLCWRQVEKEREALRFEMNKAAAQMKEADAAIAAQKAELDKLNQIITEADQVASLTMFVCVLVFQLDSPAERAELRASGLGLSSEQSWRGALLHSSCRCNINSKAPQL